MNRGARGNLLLSSPYARREERRGGGQSRPEVKGWQAEARVGGSRRTQRAKGSSLKDGRKTKRSASVHVRGDSAYKVYLSGKEPIPLMNPQLGGLFLSSRESRDQ